MRLLQFAIVAFLSLSSWAGPSPAAIEDIFGDTRVIQEINQRKQQEVLSPEEEARLDRERAERVDRIAQAGDRKPDDLRRQNEVARALATVNEGERAVPYAERTVELAEKTGKPRNIATALTTAALAYKAAGRYDEAYRRAARAIEVDSGSREAVEVYQSLKGKGNPPIEAVVAPGLMPKKSGNGVGR